MQSLINQELLDTFPTIEATLTVLPTDVNELLRIQDLNMQDFLTSVLTGYARLNEREIRSTVERTNPTTRSADPSLMNTYVSKFTMVLSTTPTIRSKYL